MNFDPTQLRIGLLKYIILVAGLCLRQWGRAYAADRLGDPTPAMEGRVTLNPLVHMDLFGSVIFPLVSIFIFPAGILFCWGKPVFFNPSYFAKPRRDEILATLAGPAANLLFALVCTIALGFAYRFDPNTAELFGLILTINVSLAVFYLIPLPPLDGGILLKHLINMSEELFLTLSQWSFFILIVLINLPPVQYVLRLVMILFAAPFVMLYNIITR